MIEICITFPKSLMHGEIGGWLYDESFMAGAWWNKNSGFEGVRGRRRGVFQGEGIFAEIGIEKMAS